MPVDCYRIVFAGRLPAAASGGLRSGFGALLGPCCGRRCRRRTRRSQAGTRGTPAPSVAAWGGAEGSSMIGGCGGAGQVGNGFVLSAGLGGRLAALPVPTTTPARR